MHKSKEKRIVKAVCSYLPDLLLREIAAKDPFDPSAVILLSGGLLQADASGFTRMSERLSQIGSKGAEELTEIFNRFFSSMLKIVFANGGDVLKFGGDSLLVFFQGEKGPWRAAVTATEMQKRMSDFRSISTSCGIFRLALHIGINAGEFSAISLGDPREKLELAVLGRNVALTIRCNETAGPGETLLTQSCYGRLRGKVQVSEKRGEFRKLHLPKGSPKAIAQPSRRKVREESLRQLSQTLVPYLPRGIYRKIESEPGRSFVESEHRKITVVFLNLIYSEKLLEGLTGKRRKSSTVLRECFEAVQTVVAEHGGVIARIDPYSDGDKVLILFGAPVAQEDDEERAIRCALRIREKLKSQGLPWHGSIAQRTGINTGNAFCGEVGSRDRKEYTVMGKDVNLAARLMSKADPGEILVSERTFTTVSSAFAASELKVKAKGITQPLRAFKIKDAVNRPAARSKRKNNTNGQTPLFGRKREISRINRIIAKVAGGRAQILSIKGEAGIGKSRLTEELVNLCTDKGMSGVLVDCHFYGSNTPLLPWIEVLRNHWGLADNDESEEKTNKLVQALEKIDSVRWAPLFNDLLGISVAENEWTKSLERKTRRQILFETITGLITRHITGAATYLVLEDTHWIDQTSTELLSHFAREISGHPVFLVLVHRPELRLRCLEGMEDYQEMLLGELSQQDALDLARSHLEIAKLPDQIAKLAWEKSRGNPLYLRELMHSLRDSGHLIWNRRDERYELSAQASRIKIPDTVQDVITSRIDRLDETARKVIKTASVIGRVFSLGTLSSVLPFPLSPWCLRRTPSRIRNTCSSMH
jgi:class 3 adenylate cyclase